MKNMTASVRTSDGEIITITSEYKTKAEFKHDLNRNGYKVIGRITFEGEKETTRSRLYDRGYRMR